MGSSAGRLPSINVPLTDSRGRISPIWHEFLRSFVSSAVENTDNPEDAAFTVTAGAGLTGGGTGNVTLNVGAGDGISVDADDINVDISGLTRIQATLADELMVTDVSENNSIRKTTVSDIIGNVTFPQSAYRLISSQSASSSAQLDFTVSSEYGANIFVIVDLKPATDNQRLYARTSADNGSSYDSGAGNYSYVFQGGTTAPADAGTTGSSAATEIHLCSGVGNDVNEVVNGTVIVYAPTNVSYTIFQSDLLPIGATGVLSRNYGGGMRLSAAAVTNVRFLFASGNIASGTIYQYGVVNA